MGRQGPDQRSRPLEPTPAATHPEDCTWESRPSVSAPEVMQRNLYSRLILCGNVLRSAFEGDSDRRDDRYWTSTAYFNAVRELAGAKSVIEQDSMRDSIP